MGKKKRALEFTTRLTREDAAGVIEALIEGLKEGRLKVQKSGETLELEVPRVIDLEIEAELTAERAEFEIEVSWRPNREENPDIDESERKHGKGGKERNGDKAVKDAAKAAKKAAKEAEKALKESASAAKAVVKDKAKKAKKVAREAAGVMLLAAETAFLSAETVARRTIDKVKKAAKKEPDKPVSEAKAVEAGQSATEKIAPAKASKKSAAQKSAAKKPARKKAVDGAAAPAKAPAKKPTAKKPAAKKPAAQKADPAKANTSESGEA